MWLLLWSCALLLLLQHVCGVVEGVNGQLVPQRGRVDSGQRGPWCSWPCRCGPRPQCEAGVSAVLDGCGCCKTCARQVGDDCNERDVCDPHKGLYCDFSKDRPRFQLGVCAYMMGVGCDLNSVHYENGEAFQPSPLYKCTCISGAIGCTPAFIQKPAAMLGHAPGKHAQDTSYGAVMPAYRDAPLAWKRNCLLQVTPWSACSRTCGLGISIRVSNDNGKCEMRKERRLCLLRPCDKKTLQSVKIPQGKTCRATFQARKAEVLTLSGCSSVKKLRPTYCGVCTDRRCCAPNRSNMQTVQFSCADGATVQWRMQWITSCVCQRRCSQPADMFSELYLL